ncbi:DUF1553 domain-containing protein [Mariniblastus fucicola]|uniref:Planctomycete cytochrome C n=1 Tax=Mariniblastus fucicola TaxID=980251 RepID=A0A5B9P4P5_9BACT|nr:PSD1 and planctomycete cytochrome C domain-containing protein [Mariniblastus fucicola]QEG20459.1 Planctomycete cytochrome C [Mariniblastus fucicola]
MPDLDCITKKNCRRIAFTLLSLTWFASIGLAQEQNGPAVSFNADVRPILSKHCYACHGPDEETRAADLRLDAAGDADMEEVIERITSDDEDYVMPPPSHNKPLSDEKRSVLKRWIESGAEYERHWAFVAPMKKEVPDGTHPVDFFVDQKLKSNGLKRSPQADPATLVRRVYLDLIGLPPTIEQADAFINDPTTENYQAIVDQLLASPRYGERWARKWLDLARYADTNGYEKDRDRSIWPYRDWVIRAINEGMPFDQFTIEQLAGDMLPDATQQQLVATGFHRNTMLNEEGGIDPLEFRYHAMADRVATTGTTWLGLTTGCAQCHTHKFDPITHEDYFGIMAYMNNADEPELFLKDGESQSSEDKKQQRALKLLSELKSHWPESTAEQEHPEFQAAFDGWLEKQRANLVNWRTIVPESMSANMPHLTLEADGVIFASGDITKSDTYTLNFPASTSPITAFRLEALPDERLPRGGPGLTYYEGQKGDFFLNEIEISTADGDSLDWADASATFAGSSFGSAGIGAALSIDGDVQSGWSIAGRVGFRHVAVFNLKKPLPAGEKFTLTMKFGRHFASSLGKFRFSAVESDSVIGATLLDDSDSDTEVEQTFLMQAPQLKSHADKIRKLLHPLQGKSTLVMRERSPGQTRRTFLHHRGEYTQPEQEVQPRLPEAIFDAENQTLPESRLEFATWLVSRDNPLTARVVANRQWAAFFGTGLVKTVEDFGMQGALPSHPALLDFLAVELMDQGWSIKSLHRIIVTSETYQQSSAFEKANAEAERLLQRFPRRRLDAEVIRDSSLAAAGLLVDKMYGPPVRPPQPAGAAANYSKSNWKASEGPDRYRRSIYTYQKRTAPFAMYTTFDASSGESCVARRDASNTPLQALTLMNDPMFVEIAEALGKRMSEFEGEDAAKIEAGFRWVMTRKPNESELGMLAAFHAKHPDWKAIARVLLCLDETITKN